MKLTFATYVWQPTTVAATKAIVESWNKTHPAIQVSIVPVDVNSVHDKLLTNFVGGTAADVIHDEAADIAGFTQQGYLANLTPLISKQLQGVDSEVALGHRQLRRQAGHRRADPDADLQRLREHGHPQGGGHQGADREEPVDVDPVPLDREATHERATASASVGASARRPRRSRRWRSTTAGSTSISRAASGTSVTGLPSRRS